MRVSVDGFRLRRLRSRAFVLIGVSGAETASEKLAAGKGNWNSVGPWGRIASSPALLNKAARRAALFNGLGRTRTCDLAIMSRLL